MRLSTVACALLLPLAACDCGSKVKQGAGELAAVETQLYFGETCPKSSDPAYAVDPAVQSLHLRNDGTAAIYLNGFAIGPAEVAEIFTFDAAKVPEQLAAGDTVEIPIRFLPATSGSVSGTLTIKAEEQTLTIPLLGDGRSLPPAPQLSLSCPGGRITGQDECASTNPYIHFPDAPTNGSSEMTFTLKNLGCPKLTVKKLALSIDTPQAAPDTFAIVSGQSDGFEVPGGGQVQLKVRLSPKQQIDYDGTLSFETNDPTRSQVSLALTGAGIGPVLDVTTSVGCAHGSAQEDFSCCDFSQLTPCTGKLTIQNHGAGPFTLNGVSLQKGTSTQFAIQTAPSAGTVVPAFGTLPDAIVVKYTPAKKLESDLLLIDSTAGQVHVDIRGGAPPVLKTNPEITVDFGTSVPPGSDLYLPLTVSNPLTYSQQVELTVSSITVSGAPFTLASTSQSNCPVTLTAPATLAKGTEGSLCIHLATPAFGGEYQGQVHLFNDDPLFAGANGEKIITLHAQAPCSPAPTAQIDIPAQGGSTCPCSSGICNGGSCGVSVATRTSLTLSGATSYDPVLNAQCLQTGQDTTGIAAWEWALDSAPSAGASLSPSGKGASSTTTLTFDTPGPHTVSLIVYNKAGRPSTAATFTVAVSR